MSEELQNLIDEAGHVNLRGVLVVMIGELREYLDRLEKKRCVWAI